MALDAVPDDAVRAILSHLRVEDLWELRGCSRTLRRLAEQSTQWLPIIAPPSLSHTTLTLATHGAALRALYARYRRWQHAWVRLRNKDDDQDEPDEEALRAQSTALDGFFGHQLDGGLIFERATGGVVVHLEDDLRAGLDEDAGPL